MKKLSRNAPCGCGSGKKYKRCCWDKDFTWLVDDEGGLHREVPTSPEVQGMLDDARDEFRAKHGREPGDDDLVFGDLGHQEHVEAKIAGMLREAGIDPAKVYAFEQTGMLVTTENKDKIADEDLAAWDRAVDEYRRRVEAGDPPL